MSALLEQLMRSAQVWQGSRQVRVVAATEPSGYPSLDQVLTGGGWPRGALTELLIDRPGNGELPLLLPLMVRLTGEGRPLLWIDPPHTPYAPALQREGVRPEHMMVVHTQSPADFLWTYEQGVRSGACGLVMGWPGRLRSAQIRRLQLAAESNDSLAVLLRHDGQRRTSSPAALRICLSPCLHGLQLTLLKRRGGWSPEHPVALMPAALKGWYAPAREQGADHQAPAYEPVSSVIQGPWH